MAIPEIETNPVLDAFTPDPAIAEGVAKGAAPEPKLNRAAVYAQAKAGFVKPEDQAGFAKFVYNTEFGLPPDTSLADSTKMVHGQELDPTAATNEIINRHAPIEANDDDKSKALKQTVESLAESKELA